MSTFDAAYRFIQAGLAVAILPGEALPRHAADEYGIVAVPLRDAWAERRFAICVRDRGALTLAASHLLDSFAARGLGRCAAVALNYSRSTHALPLLKSP